MSGKFLVLLVLASFLIRAGAVTALRDTSHGPSLEQMGADGVEFNALGLHLAQSNRYELTPNNPTSFRAPGFPLVLAAVYKLAGENYRAAYALFCVLGVGTCLITYFLAREFLSDEWSKVAALLCAFYLPHIYFATVFASENAFAFCLPAALWLFIRYLKTGSYAYLAFTGSIIGFCALIRPLAILVLLAWLVVLIAAKRQNTKSLALAVVIVMAAFLAVVLPWTARNYFVFHRFVAVATNGGSTFYGSNNNRVLTEPYFYGNWISTKELPHRDRIEAATDEVTRDKVEWSLGIAWVRTHLASMPLLCAYKLIRLWLPRIDTNNRNYFLMELVGYTPIFVLFVIGLLKTVRDRECRTVEWMAVHSTIGATIFMVLIFYGSSRFRDANAAILVLYSAVGVKACIRHFPWRMTALVKKAA